MLKSGQKADTQ